MVSKDTEIVENTEKLSHGDTETQSKLVLSVSVSLWLIPLCVLNSLSVLHG